MYVKLFTSIFDGSLYGQFEPTVTFIAMLALADEKGVVDMTPEAIAAKSGFPIDVVRKGIEQIAFPDPRSRTKTEGMPRAPHSAARPRKGLGLADYELHEVPSDSDC